MQSGYHAGKFLGNDFIVYHIGAVGGLAGDAVGGSSSTSYTDGVQIVFRTASGKVLQSAQVGRPCEFKTGTAVMVSPTPNEARIQPNNPYGCGR